MTGGALRWATGTLTALLAALVTGLLGLGGTPPAVAQTAGAQTAAQDPTQAPLQPRATPQQLARLVLEEMNPRVVTVGGEPRLTVTGRVINTGDRRIDELAVRLQRGAQPLRTDAEVRAALSGTAPTDVPTRFVELGRALEPGQSAGFRIAVPLRGAPTETLQLAEPGVYPLLVNLNGTPDFGGPARLSSVPLLLPVLGLPAGVLPPAGLQSAGPGVPAGPLAQPPVSPPLPVTLLWPLVTQPSLLPVGPGEPPLLADEALADAMAPGGRLDGLVTALEQAAPPGSPLDSALCVVVDPALLDAAEAMSHGYRVASSTGIIEGRGAGEAARWLGRLRATVAGRCVLPLPYGDPDLVALSRAGLADLEALAISTGLEIVTRVLGVRPLTQVAWPAGGVLDVRTLSDLLALGHRAVLLEPRGLAEPAGSMTGGALRLAGASPLPDGTGPAAVLLDPLVATALAPTRPLVALDDAAAGTPVTAERPSGTRAALSSQDAMGILAYRALTAQGTSTGQEPPTPVVLAPPRAWAAGAAEGTALLRFTEELVASRLAVPRDLATLAAGPAAQVGVGPAALNYPVTAAAEEVPRSITGRVAQARDFLRELQGATAREPSVGLEPGALLDPLRLGLLRGVSVAWRGEPAGAARTVEQVVDRLAGLRRQVRVVQPTGPYTLASADAPVLLTLTNGLPVSVRARVQLSGAVGLRVGQVGEVVLPASSNRQVVVPAQAGRAGQFSLRVELTTPDGTPLGEPVRLQLRSTDSGTMTVVLTTSAAGVLVLLVAARLVRWARQRPEAEGRAP